MEVSQMMNCQMIIKMIIYTDDEEEEDDVDEEEDEVIELDRSIREVK